MRRAATTTTRTTVANDRFLDWDDLATIEPRPASPLPEQDVGARLVVWFQGRAMSDYIRALTCLAPAGAGENRNGSIAIAVQLGPNAKRREGCLAPAVATDEAQTHAAAAQLANGIASDFGHGSLPLEPGEGIRHPVHLLAGRTMRTSAQLDVKSTPRQEQTMIIHSTPTPPGMEQISVSGASGRAAGAGVRFPRRGLAHEGGLRLGPKSKPLCGQGHPEKRSPNLARFR